MPNLDQEIEVARRHVAEGRRIVAQQRLRMAKGECGPDGAKLLATFEQSQTIFEDHLQHLLHERNSN